MRTKGEKRKGDKTGKREAGRSKHPDDLLSTEMSVRPGLKGLVVLEPHFYTELALEYTSLVSESVLCCLSSLPWMTCMVKDPGDSWKQVFTWVLLPASKGSLQELTLTGCVFSGAEIVQLLEGFTNLKYLKTRRLRRVSWTHCRISGAQEADRAGHIGVAMPVARRSYK